MSRLKDFKLPDLGEGLTEGEILSWSVQEGDTIAITVEAAGGAPDGAPTTDPIVAIPTTAS